MKNLFKVSTILFVLFWCFTVAAQNDYVYDIAPDLQKQDPGIEAMWDVLLNFDISALSGGAAGNAGGEWNGTYFYSTRWASNLLHEYDATGTTLIREFSVTGVTGLRDLAWDGTYMYGGAAGNTIYQMDFATNTLIGTITSPVGVRFIAYDAANDAFWVGNWSDPPTLVDRSGNTLATIVTGFAGQYGAAYDDVSPGGPFLWIFDQGAGGGTPQLVHQFDIATGTATGVTHDVFSDVGAGAAGGIAGGLFSMTDFATGFFTLGGVWQGGQVPPPDNDKIFVYEIEATGPPCPVGAPTNPTPPDGATDVSINPGNATWTNGSGTLFNEVYFGELGSLALVYDGTPITSFAIPGPLNYATTYGWRVVCKNDTCSTSGPQWTFTTMQNPLLVIDTAYVYPQSVAYWTGTTDGVTKTENSLVRGLDIEDGWFMFDISSITDAATITEVTFFGYVNSTNWPYWSLTPLPGLNPLTATAAELKAAIEANSAQGTAYVYSNESSTFVPGAYNYLCETYTNADLEAALVQDWFAAGMDSRDNSTTYFLTWDGWNEVNVPYLCVVYEWIIPVELTSFTASVNENDVTLNWSTATETNNQGFQVERSSGGEFENIGFVEGYGTTTEIQTYSYTDKNVEVGTYSYRLKQIDFDGTFEYSDVVEVDLLTPKTFALSQNYPNPFNPSTIVEFSLATDSRVSLKVFDVLGQEVMTVVNSSLVAGVHTVDIDASLLNSGVYFYQIEANGVDGTKFVDVKKMMLTK
jgi:hypothetical protein